MLGSHFENATAITKPFFKEFNEEVKLESLRKELLNPEFLPTYEQVREAFIQDINGERQWDENLWRKFTTNKGQFVYELFTEEYIDKLAEYFVERSNEYKASQENPLVILEIGAGNGRLSYFLGKKLEEKALGQIKIIATDSGGWNLKRDRDSFVEDLDYKEAMEKYKPSIVISSWMPYKKDFTQDIRNSEGVQEYVLIGETDGGCCGDEWKTWGWGNFEGEEKMPPYKEDGFTRVDLEMKQIGRSDRFADLLDESLLEEPLHRSSTVSFRKEKENV
jgi:hypothetical protein